MAMTILYEVYDGLYANITNRCSAACAFCVRQNSDTVHEADSLWLDHEPSLEEVIAEFDRFDMGRYSELVFCGFGEPTMRFDDLLAIARIAKERYGIRTRINTNGQGSLANNRNIVPEMQGIIDCVSVSLNAPNAQRYQELTQSIFGEDAFWAMLEFARDAHTAKIKVIMTTVSTTISQEEEGLCQKICDDLGATYRIRALG